MEKHQDFINKVSQFCKNKVNFKEVFKGIYRIFLGISHYPDKSNLASTCDLYKFENEVAFFSSKEKPELLFVFAILFGDNEQAYKFVSYMNSNPSKPITWNDVIEYLAIVEGIYFKNLHSNFPIFERNIGNQNALYLIFSSNVKNSNVVKSYRSCKDYACIIHPSSKNLNSRSLEWFQQYVLSTFRGNI